jgi:PqqD family protein of HPr-rel-A system
VSPFSELSTGADPTYRFADDIGLAWRAWDGELVVFSEVSGDTHRLDLLASATFEALLNTPGTLTELISRVAEELDLAPDARLGELVSAALEKFRELGLLAA